MRQQGTESLQRLLKQDYPGRLAKAALLLTHAVQPHCDVTAYSKRLQDYAVSVSERLPSYARLGDVLFHLNDFLFNDCGFYTSTAYARSPELNYLNQVMDSRSGSPLSIAIIYLTVGRWLGLPLQGMLFPGRVLVTYRDEDGTVVLDPADGGLSLQEKDLEVLISHTFSFTRPASTQPRHFLAASEDKTLLVNMLRQLKQAYLSRGELEHALWALERILALVPELASGFRERGHLYELLDCRYAAAMDYTHYLELLPDARDAAHLRKRLPELLRTPVTLH
jgi:regulator of sirC expression with transglutaminase-like and TPR domain